MGGRTLLCSCLVFLTVSLSSKESAGYLIPVIRGLTAFPHVPAPSISIRMLEKAFERAEFNFQKRAEFESMLTEFGGTLSKSRITTQARHQRFTYMEPQSFPIDRNCQIFEETSKLLARNFNLTLGQSVLGLPLLDLAVAGSRARRHEGTCQRMFMKTQCDPYERYRSADGSCNNIDNSLWGKSFTCFERLLPPVYDDGLSTLRMSKGGGPLPNPRVLSHYIHNDVNRPTLEYSLMTMQWGQFIDHDMTMAPTARAGNNMDMIQCCPENGMEGPMPMPLHPECMPIPLPLDDPFFGPLRQTCLNFVRTATCAADCRLGPREQINQITAFLDASQVYGNTENVSMSLREFRGGRLRIQKRSRVGALLPPSKEPSTDQCSSLSENITCFQAGDERVNQHPALTTLHTVFLRHHNRLAGLLQKTYPGASDEFLYQEARRIVGAQLQAITYGEFLPVVLGKSYMKYFNLEVAESGFSEYDPSAEPSIIHEFSTAAYRFGHSLIDNIFPEYDKRGRRTKDLQLQDNFFFPFSLFEGELDPLIRGMVAGPSQLFDRHLVDAVRNHLYKPRGDPFGMDLPSLNIQRGRDHGLSPYTSYIQYCFHIKIRRFSDLQIVMSGSNWRRLKMIYESVHDIDLFTGGVSETALEGAAVGPTFGCILGLQFYHLKFGDRFYFEHGHQAGSFNSYQLGEIRNTRLSQILCANTDIKTIPINAFRPTSEFVRCDSLRDPNLQHW